MFKKINNELGENAISESIDLGANEDFEQKYYEVLSRQLPNEEKGAVLKKTLFDTNKK